MRIGLFVSVAGRGDSGPETYEHSLLRALVQDDRVNDYELICFNQRAADSFGISQSNVHFRVLSPNNRPMALAYSLPRALRASSIKVLHATFVPPLFASKPYVMTQHGSDMFVHPEFFQPLVRLRLTALLKRGLRNAAKIICVSQHVRDEIGNRFNIAPERLAVVHHGKSDLFSPTAPEEARDLLSRRYNIKKPFVLYVGKMLASKNIYRLIEAFSRFRTQSGADLQLVMVGRTYPRMGKLDETIMNAGAGDSIVRVGHIDHAELPPFFRAATMFAFPSLWEGFGLPVIEAMACGTPVITSNNSSLPEVVGDSALLVDPYSVDEIEAAITRLFTDPELADSLRSKGLERASQFSWRRAAEETKRIYQEFE